MATTTIITVTNRTIIMVQRALKANKTIKITIIIRIVMEQGMMASNNGATINTIMQLHTTITIRLRVLMISQRMLRVNRQLLKTQIQTSCQLWASGHALTLTTLTLRALPISQ